MIEIKIMERVKYTNKLNIKGTNGRGRMGCRETGFCCGRHQPPGHWQ
jgi:hypothetical protein